MESQVGSGMVGSRFEAPSFSCSAERCGSTCRCELANGIRESGVNSDRDADFPRLAEVSESLDYSIARIPGLGVATGKDPKVDEGGRVGGKGILPVEPSQADGLNHSDIYNHSWRLLSPEWL